MKLGSVLSCKGARQKSQLLPWALLSTSCVFREPVSICHRRQADPPSDSLGGCDVYQINEFSSWVSAKVVSWQPSAWASPSPMNSLPSFFQAPLCQVSLILGY